MTRRNDVCRHVRLLVSRHLDGRLDEAHRPAVQRHLRMCDGCRRSYRSDQRLSALAQQTTTDDVDDDLVVRVKRTLFDRAVAAGRSERRASTRRWMERAAAALLLVIGVGAAYVVGRRHGEDAAEARVIVASGVVDGTESSQVSVNDEIVESTDDAVPFDEPRELRPARRSSSDDDERDNAKDDADDDVMPNGGDIVHVTDSPQPTKHESRLRVVSNRLLATDGAEGTTARRLLEELSLYDEVKSQLEAQLRTRGIRLDVSKLLDAMTAEPRIMVVMGGERRDRVVIDEKSSKVSYQVVITESGGKRSPDVEVVSIQP